LIEKIFNEEKKYFIFTFLLICLILVCLPRFDRADYGPVKKFVGTEDLYEGLPYDILIYKNYIEFLRTGAGEEKVTSPYSYRVLVPSLASGLPFAPLTSLNLVNLFFLITGLIFLYLMLANLNLEFEYRVIGCLMYIFSFPMFYYATSGYIDGTIIGILIACVYFVISEKWKSFFLFLMLGTLASEKIIILLPFFISYLISKKLKLKTSLLLISLFIIIYLSITFLLRKYAPGISEPYVWTPGSNFILQNIYRPKTYLSFLITLGIPGIIAFISYLKLSDEKVKYYSYYYVGCATSILLFLYSIFSAWSDGRTVWTIYPFAIPLTVIYLKFRKEKAVKV